MDSALLCHRLGMYRAALSPLLRSFERNLRAANRSERTIASYLESLRQTEGVPSCSRHGPRQRLPGRPRSLPDTQDR
jgi:hypothetical protein